MIAVGYIRVSSDQQAQEGLSLITQTERLNAWATTKGISLERVVSDEGSSGGTLDRPGLKSILDDLSPINAVGTLCAKYRRFLGQAFQQIFNMRCIAVNALSRWRLRDYIPCVVYTDSIPHDRETEDGSMPLKAGLYVDAPNFYRKDGPSLNYRAIKDFVSNRY